jgi:hypothetical protein
MQLEFRQFQEQEHARKRWLHNLSATSTSTVGPLQVPELYDLKNKI